MTKLGDRGLPESLGETGRGDITERWRGGYWRRVAALLDG